MGDIRSVWIGLERSHLSTIERHAQAIGSELAHRRVLPPLRRAPVAALLHVYVFGRSSIESRILDGPNVEERIFDGYVSEGGGHDRRSHAGTVP